MKFWNANCGAAVILFALLPVGVIAQTAPATKAAAPATKDDAASAKASATAAKVAAPAPQVNAAAGTTEPKPTVKKKRARKATAEPTATAERQANAADGASEPKPAAKKRRGKKAKTADSAAPVEPSIPLKPCAIQPVMTDEMLKACGARPSPDR